MQEALSKHHEEWTASANQDLTDAKQVQQWTVFYLIAAAVAVLGVAFETPSFGRSPIFDLVELSAWVTLAVSVGAGLSCVRALADFYILGSKTATALGQAEEGRLYKAGGNEWLTLGDDKVSVDEYVQKHLDSARTLDEQAAPTRKRIMRLGKMQFRFFVTGIAFLGVARGGPAAIDALTELYEFVC